MTHCSAFELLIIYTWRYYNDKGNTCEEWQDKEIKRERVREREENERGGVTGRGRENGKGEEKTERIGNRK